uniref:Uncharacterized protein n=1 Tax=Cacopsylla melanoneura TaxID=428564 RepID=A0A8D8RGK2_9HEMI
MRTRLWELVLSPLMSYEKFYSRVYLNPFQIFYEVLKISEILIKVSPYLTLQFSSNIRVFKGLLIPPPPPPNNLLDFISMVLMSEYQPGLTDSSLFLTFLLFLLRFNLLKG